MASPEAIPAALQDYIEDIDADDELRVYRYLTELEVKYPIEENYLSKHVYITARVRSASIDWLRNIQVEFSLVVETLHLSVGIIDRYLQMVPVLNLEQLRLVTLTAMLIASKYEENNPLCIVDLIYLSSEECSKKDICRCEREILSYLDFRVAGPTPISFLRRFHKAAGGNKRESNLAKYLIDMALVEATMAHYKPSELAASAMCLSLLLISNKVHKQVWTPNMTYYTGYSSQHLWPIVQKMVRVFLVNSIKF